MSCDLHGTAFDPNFHNAVMHVEDESLGENVIAETFQQGFQIGDKAYSPCDGESRKLRVEIGE